VEIESEGCERCKLILFELVNGFNENVSEMRRIAAEGKGVEDATATSVEFNRYFGANIVLDTLIKEFYPAEYSTLETEDGQPLPPLEESPV